MITGSPSIGHYYVESDLTSDQVRNANSSFDVSVAGSVWNEELFKSSGIKNVVCIPQGVDREIFNEKPMSSRQDDKFIIFSGGKYEHRKAQDIVYKAFQIIRERHDDVCLVASWENIFDRSAKIPGSGEKGISRVDLRTQEGLADYMCNSHIGVFPNRCEGGTNLVLMEYLACGRPVIANYITGQKDVLDKEYAYLVCAREDKELLDQTVEGLEWAYKNRESLEPMGKKASAAMDKFTWAETARKFYEVCK